MQITKRFRDFCLLMWKDMLLKIRKPADIMMIIILVVVTCLAICFQIWKTTYKKHEAVTYNSFTVTNGTFEFAVLFWSPCGNPSLTKMVRNVAKNFNVEERCFVNSDDLHNALQYHASQPIIGIQFQDELGWQYNIAKNMKITLRFADKPVPVGSYWKTGNIFPEMQEAGPRGFDNVTGAEPYYHETGFLAVQNHIIQEFLKTHTNDQFPVIQMRRFPYPAWVSYKGFGEHIPTIALFLLLGLTCHFHSVLQDVSIEKETKIKEIMKIMGISNSLHWIAWYITGLLCSLVPIILIVIFMTMPIFAEHAVFPLVSSVLLFVYLMLYMSAVITFAFAVTVFCSRSTMAGVIGVILFVLIMIPGFEKLSFSKKFGSCLLVNSAFVYGVQIIGEHEVLHRSLSLGNVFEPISSEAQLSLGLVMLMFIIDSIIYMLIALYVEAVLPGEYGLARVWYFPFTSSFWCQQFKVSRERGYKSFVHEEHYYEREPVGGRIGIQLLGLEKKYGKNRVVLHDLTCNILEDEVTILLGHNGAGKTTTMFILTGIIPPTGGTAIINGYDIRTDMENIRKSLGFCAQENILFDLLTVSEHLNFYCTLRGLRGQLRENEVAKFLNSLDLKRKRKMKSKNLSGGMKRKLCVGIALCGNSKVCIMDEPTSGMDPTSRRQLWDVIQAEKKGRTILLSTHFMNEADILGDRIAILGSGTLQCYGSSFFLKKAYGRGYRLIIVKEELCNVEAITYLLEKYIPGIHVEEDTIAELTYVLPESNLKVFEMMLTALENKSRSLGIQSYGISLATLEEVFMRVGIEHDFAERIQTSISNEGFTDKGAFKEYCTGITLYGNQILAMLMKKALVTLKEWFLLVVHILLVIAIMILSMIILKTFEKFRSAPNLDFSLDSYSSPITVVTTSDGNNLYYKRYKQILQHENREVIDWHNEDMNHHMIEKTSEDTDQVRMRFIIGATFLSNNTIVAWFNNEPFHSPPLALQYVQNAILKEKLGNGYSIQFSNYPSPKSIKETSGSDTVYYTLAVGVSMVYVVPYFIMFYVKERRSQSKHLQLVSGTAVSAFWFVAFIWDFTIFLLMSSCVIIVFVSFNARMNFGAVMVLLVLFGYAILPFVYLMSFLFKQPTSAYSAINIISMLLGLLAFVLVRLALVNQIPQLAIVDELLLYFPFYNLLCGVNNVSLVDLSRERCDIINKQAEKFDLVMNISQYEDAACFLVPNMCCDLEYYSMGNGIGRNIIYLITTGAILFLILLIYEYRFGDYVLYVCNSFKSKPPKDEGTEDVDVLEEKQLIRSGQVEPTKYTVVLRNMTKYYSGHPVVNQLCLGLKQSECFGLLGVNGAGKTTAFKMMTGDIRISYGTGWICGWNLKSNMKNVHSCIGYCPQFDALLDNLTVKETLIMYCLIRGVPLHDCESTINDLGKDFGFNKHMRKKISQLSGGNKRKVSTAIALIGELPVIFLDEPSTGMDPSMKRFLWNKINRLRNRGKCLILTTHSMDECEAVCTKVAIMVNGAFQCLGSIQYLKNKFSKGYVLIIKVRKPTSESQLQVIIPEVQKFVQTNFPDSELRERHDTLLTYIVQKRADITWAGIFGIMERGKKTVKDIEDYSISQFDLEQIFLHFAQMQKK